MVTTAGNITFEQHQFMYLQEQHAEVDGVRAIIALSHTAAAMRYGVPVKIDTGKFRPRKGTPITICPQGVINKYPWDKYCRTYNPQHDHSFLSRAFVLTYPDYSDFIMRFYTKQYRDPSPEVHQHLLIMSQLTVIEKIFKEKYAVGETAFAYPFVYQLLRECYHFRIDYNIRRRAVYTAARKHKWDEVKTEHMLIQAREERQGAIELLRLAPLPTPLTPLPPGVPRIILLGQGDDHASV